MARSDVGVEKNLVSLCMTFILSIVLPFFCVSLVPFLSIF